MTVSVDADSRFACERSALYYDIYRSGTGGMRKCPGAPKGYPWPPTWVLASEGIVKHLPSSFQSQLLWNRVCCSDSFCAG